MSVDVGHAFVWGKDADTAAELLAAADLLGLDPITVRSVEDGFIVPDLLADHMATVLSDGPHVYVPPAPSDEVGD